MMRRREAVLFLAAGLAGISCEAKNKAPPDARPEKPLKIAVIPKGTTHEFWKSVHAGAAKAAQDIGGVELVWKGPLKEDDLKSQIDIVESMTAQGVNGMVLAPLNDKALVNPVKAAGAAKIPVVIFDSALQGTDYAAFVATDNLGAGVKAADHLAKAMGDTGKALVLRYQEGSASTAQREEGFLRTMRGNHTNIAIVSDNQFGGATTESAFAAAENLLAAQKAAEGGVTGIFCPNESTTFGMLLALQKAGLAGKIKFVGFDASEKLVQGVRDGHIDGLVLQSPFAMGELAVRAVVSQIRGLKQERRLDTPARLVSKLDLDTPEVKELLHPDLKRWLKE